MICPCGFICTDVEVRRWRSKLRSIFDVPTAGGRAIKSTRVRTKYIKRLKKKKKIQSRQDKTIDDIRKRVLTLPKGFGEV